MKALNNTMDYYRINYVSQVYDNIYTIHTLKVHRAEL